MMSAPNDHHRIQLDTSAIILFSGKVRTSRQHTVRRSASLAKGPFLRLHRPLMPGEDARLQKALVRGGADPDVDGLFGPPTAAAVETCQRGLGRAGDGMVGPNTRAALPPHG